MYCKKCKTSQPQYDESIWICECKELGSNVNICSVKDFLEHRRAKRFNALCYRVLSLLMLGVFILSLWQYDSLK